MKNIFNIILGLAVAGLYILHFTGGNDSAVDAKAQDSTKTKKIDRTGMVSNIAYVNTDSLWSKYEYYQDMRDDLLKEKEVLERQYENQMKKFENKVIRFREKAPMLSQREGQRQQTAIMEEEQRLVQLQEDLTLQLAESETEKNESIRARIVGEIETFNLEGGYDFILGYSLSSDVIYADDRLDVTAEIVKRLNEKYRAEQGKK